MLPSKVTFAGSRSLTRNSSVFDDFAPPLWGRLSSLQCQSPTSVSFTLSIVRIHLRWPSFLMLQPDIPDTLVSFLHILSCSEFKIPHGIESGRAHWHRLNSSLELQLSISRPSRLIKIFSPPLLLGGNLSSIVKVASAKRSVRPGRKTVKLTSSQVAIAKKLGVPLEEYAKQLKNTEGA